MTRATSTFAPRPPACASARGFTLIELMTAVIVAAVLLAVAAPGLASFVRSSRLSAVQSELVSSMMLARSEAAKRGQDVQLVALNRTSGTDFSGGWIVWWDGDGDGNIGSGETLRTYPAPTAGVVVKTEAALASVRFSANGFLSPPSAMTFYVCDTGNRSKSYVVSLGAVGLADIKSPINCPATIQ